MMILHPHPFCPIAVMAKAFFLCSVAEAPLATWEGAAGTELVSVNAVEIPLATWPHHART